MAHFQVSTCKISNILAFIQSLCCKIQTALDIALKVCKFSPQSSFNLFFNQCVRFGNINDPKFKFIESLDCDELMNEIDDAWCKIAKYLSITIHLIHQNKIIQSQINKYCEKIKVVTKKFIENKNSKMTDLFLNHNKNYNQDDFDINLNEIIWEKELEICSICRLPLIDDAFDNKHLYKFSCCDTKCHLYCSLRLIFMRCCKSERKCQNEKCLKIIPEFEIDRITKLKNIRLNKEKDFKIIQKDQIEYERKNQKNQRLICIHFNNGKNCLLQKRIIYDVIGETVEDFESVDSVWRSV